MTLNRQTENLADNSDITIKIKNKKKMRKKKAKKKKKEKKIQRCIEKVYSLALAVAHLIS